MSAIEDHDRRIDGGWLFDGHRGYAQPDTSLRGLMTPSGIMMFLADCMPFCTQSDCEHDQQVAP